MSFSFSLIEMRKIGTERWVSRPSHIAAPMEGLIEVLKCRPKPEICAGTGPSTSNVLKYLSYEWMNELLNELTYAYRCLQIYICVCLSYYYLFELELCMATHTHTHTLTHTPSIQNWLNESWVCLQSPWSFLECPILHTVWTFCAQLKIFHTLIPWQASSPFPKDNLPALGRGMCA